MIRQNHGITLTSLIIYILAMCVVVSIISTLTTFFYKEIMVDNDNKTQIEQFGKFNMFFLEDIKEYGNGISEVDENGQYIVFSNGNAYRISKNNIYRNNVLICESISTSNDRFFEVKEVGEKQVVVVNMNVGNDSSKTEYTLKTEI